MRLVTILSAALTATMAPAAAQAQEQPPHPSQASSLQRAVEAAVRSGRDNLARHRPAEALADFDRAIALAPNWGAARAHRGLALIELRRYAEAEAEMAIALRVGGADPFVHQSIGDLHAALGEFGPAVQAYSRVLEMEPRNTEARYKRALAYAGLRQMDAALADFDRIIVAEPRRPYAHYEKARIFAHLGLQAEALAAIDRAIVLDPADYYYRSWRGDFLYRFGQPAQAAAAYRAALAGLEARVAAMPPGRPASWVRETRMNLLGRSGRHAEALGLVEAELRRSPGSREMLAARCWLRMEAGIELAQALGDCDSVLAAEPNHVVARPARARLYLRLRRWADAERDFDGLVAEGSRSESNALYGRGIARIRMGDGARGERDLREARHRKFDVAWEFDRLGLAESDMAPTAR